jgi:hypothetical protein
MENVETPNIENNINESTSIEAPKAEAPAETAPKGSSYFIKNNNVLIVSEKEKSVFLPYSEKEVLEYLEQYPDQYKSFDDVVMKEFIFPIDAYLGHSAIARFRESYSLIRDKEAKSVFDALKYAFNMMVRHDLHPAIIAACKSQNQLENYLDCLNRKKLYEFKDFEIKFEVAPMSV